MADKGNNSGNRLWSPVSRGWGVSSKAEKDSSQTQNQAPSPLHSNDATYSQLKEYEARRRLAHSTKFDSMSLYWKSYRDLLAAAIVETGRTHRLVLGTCRAHQAYADAMSALHEDVFLDEKGNVANEKQQKSLLSTRKAIHESQTFARGKSVLSEIKDAQHVVASQFGENARNMDEEIAETIGALLNDVKQQFSTIEELGSSVLVELEKTEVEVTTAWERYLSKANSMSGTPTASSATSPQETAPNGVFLDIWVVETQYRVAVAYQNAAWDKGSFMLDDIFRKVKQDEIVRRMNLREFLVAFVQRQQRLFLSLQGVNNKVLEGLVSKELNQVDIEREIQSTITNRTKAGALLSEMLENENPNLDSPLNSDLLSKAKVVQRRGLAGGVATIGSNFEWKISLAIVTADCYLHFFDIEDPRVDATSSPDVAFQALMPTVIAPTSDNMALGKSNFSKGWSDPLAPTDSMILAKCVLQGIDETSFTLIEKGGGATTASKMFGKLVDKKVQIRSQGKGEKDDFIAILTTQY